MKNKIAWKSQKKMSKLPGTLRKKGKKGTYYYRIQIATGERREFSLKTCDPDGGSATSCRYGCCD